MFKIVELFYTSLLLYPVFCEVLRNPKYNFKHHDYEIVYLSAVLSRQEAITEDNTKVEEIALEFSAFGRPISMKFQENNNLVSSKFKTNIIDGDNINFLPYQERNCYFLHKDSFMVAAINNCEPKSISGFIFLDNITLEINPLLNFEEEPLIFERSPNLSEERVPHVIKRAFVAQEKFLDDALYINEESVFDNYEYQTLSKRNNAVSPDLTLEVALFFDEAAYKIFSPYLNYDDEKLRDMLLAYVNGVQALYKHPSIGKPLNIVLVRMDIMKRQPSRLHHYNGERSKLLNSFCEYQDEINPKSDEDEDHWDMGLYVSGLDFFAYENGQKSSVTLGLATVGGVCLGRYACVIAELGTTNIFGKPYPSAGFTSVYIMAHEIGHNLGMRHDSSGNSCSKEGYIMSPSRGTQGETQWSTCSAEVMSNLGWAKCLKDKGRQKKEQDHSKFLGSPGKTYTAKKQCEILLKDKDAFVVPENDPSLICYSIRCKTPHRSGYYFAGPALDGTECGENLHCYGGDCIKRSQKPINVIPGGWGPWKTSECKSGCIEKSKGYQTRERKCNNPIPVNTDKGCDGLSYQHVLCKDSKVCKSKRKTVIQYASEKCEIFAKTLSELDPKGAGLQAPHENDRLWMGCAIFCKRRGGSYYTPRVELNDLGIEAYFPDGTWCHSEKGQNYYCNHHHCLAENFEFSKSWFLNELDDGIDFPQNALPHGLVPQDLKPFFTLENNGKPPQIKPNFEIHLPKEEEWETDDYVLLPDDALNKI